jgi:hypothetical protein
VRAPAFLSGHRVGLPRLSDASMDHAAPLSFTIAGITVTIVSRDPFLRLDVEGSAQAFLGKAADPDIYIRTQWSDDLRIGQGTPVFNAGGHWQLCRQGRIFRFAFTAPQFGSDPYRVASFDPGFTRGEVLLNRRNFEPDLAVFPLAYPLDELLLQNHLAAGRGIEVHALGILDPQGRGRLLVGHSGAGKTTLAWLLEQTRGLTLLSDDRIILRPSVNGSWLYGTPWHGDARVACPSGGPLAGVYFLKHGPRNTLRPLTPGAAAAALFARSFPPLYRREALDFTLGFCGEVALSVPCQIFEFVPDRRVADFLLKEAA